MCNIFDDHFHSRCIGGLAADEMAQSHLRSQTCGAREPSHMSIEKKKNERRPSMYIVYTCAKASSFNLEKYNEQLPTYLADAQFNIMH